MIFCLRSTFVAAAAAAFLIAPVAAEAQSNRWLPYEGHMTVHFSIDHGGMSLMRGTFREMTGELIFDENNPEASQISVQIESASFDTGHHFRDHTTRGPWFLDSQQYRYITSRAPKSPRPAKRPAR